MVSDWVPPHMRPPQEGTTTPKAEKASIVDDNTAQIDFAKRQDLHARTELVSPTIGLARSRWAPKYPNGLQETSHNIQVSPKIDHKLHSLPNASHLRSLTKDNAIQTPQLSPDVNLVTAFGNRVIVDIKNFEEVHNKCKHTDNISIRSAGHTETFVTPQVEPATSSLKSVSSTAPKPREVKQEDGVEKEQTSSEHLPPHLRKVDLQTTVVAEPTTPKNTSPSTDFRDLHHQDISTSVHVTETHPAIPTRRSSTRLDRELKLYSPPHRRGVSNIEPSTSQATFASLNALTVTTQSIKDCHSMASSNPVTNTSIPPHLRGISETSNMPPNRPHHVEVRGSIFGPFPSTNDESKQDDDKLKSYAKKGKTVGSSSRNKLHDVPVSKALGQSSTATSKATQKSLLVRTPPENGQAPSAIKNEHRDPQSSNLIAKVQDGQSTPSASASSIHADPPTPETPITPWLPRAKRGEMKRASHQAGDVPQPNKRRDRQTKSAQKPITIPTVAVTPPVVTREDRFRQVQGAAGQRSSPEADSSPPVSSPADTTSADYDVSHSDGKPDKQPLEFLVQPTFDLIAQHARDLNIADQVANNDPHFGEDLIRPRDPKRLQIINELIQELSSSEKPFNNPIRNSLKAYYVEDCNIYQFISNASDDGKTKVDHKLESEWYVGEKIGEGFSFGAPNEAAAAERPLGWLGRPCFNSNDISRIKFIYNWMQDRVDDALCQPINCDTTDERWTSGRHPSGGEGKNSKFFFLYPVYPVDWSCSYPIHKEQYPETIAKMLAISTEDRIKERVAEIREGKRKRREVRASMQLVTACDYAEPAIEIPSAATPKINIYLRPAEKRDAQQLAWLYNSYVQFSARVLEEEETAAELWIEQILTAETEHLPFLVAARRSKSHERSQEQNAIGKGTFSRRKADFKKKYGEGRSLYDEDIVGFAYAEDYGGKKTSMKNTVEMYIYVKPEQYGLGVGKTLMDKLMHALDYGHSWGSGCTFLGEDSARYEYGGDREPKHIVMQIGYFLTPRDTIEFEKLRDYVVKRWAFEHTGTLPSIGEKNNKEYVASCRPRFND
ncbi:hypothetical protein MMC25_002555 [Agyrium rufum]|nr:hypothetical protein [Agyrium rufum]